MNVVWSQTALAQLDEIYDTIATERDIATATKWFFKISDAVAELADFPLVGSIVPESAFADHFTDLAGLRQLVVRPYRVIYEATDTACNILGVMRTSRLIGLSILGTTP
jgi:plasmid stabilization system protein ParE